VYFIVVIIYRGDDYLRRVMHGALMIFIFFFIVYTYNYFENNYKFYVAFIGGVFFKSISSSIKKGLRII
jgi:hypothetical protein